MKSTGSLLLFLVLAAASAFPADEDLVFRSDVSLVRVDAQVVDRANRAITGLQQEDFRLLESGAEREIRNFEREEMPVDVVLLLDVSGSMRPHIERIASAAHTALAVLGSDDRVAVMVFDRSTRLRLPFRNSREAVQRELEAILNHESFDGGTDITRALYDAATYVGRDGRPVARRAIVILTDDQTERGRDEAGVLRGLARADSVLSALIAPPAIMSRGPVSIGSPWPGGGMGGPLGGIIFGRRGPLGTPRRMPGPIGGGLQSAGTESIAKRSGGDSMRVDDATAFEQTLTRIRQRYALHFNLPEGVQPGQERDIEVHLSAAARRRYPDAEVRYRRSYFSPGGSPYEPVSVSRPELRSENPPPVQSAPPRPDQPVSEPRKKGGWRTADDPSTQKELPAAGATDDTEQPQPGRGWRRVKPGEQP